MTRVRGVPHSEPITAPRTRRARAAEKSGGAAFRFQKESEGGLVPIPNHPSMGFGQYLQRPSSQAQRSRHLGRATQNKASGSPHKTFFPPESTARACQGTILVDTCIVIIIVDRPAHTWRTL